MKKIVSSSLLIATFGSAKAMADVSHPLEFVQRARTNPSGQLSLAIDTGLSRVTTTIGAVTESATIVPLGVGIKYGVTPDLEVSMTYGMTLKEYEAKGRLGIGAAYSLLNSGSLSMAADLAVGYDLEGETMAPVQLGAETFFGITPQLGVYTPGRQLSITVDAPSGAKKPIILSLPVGAIYQASPQLAAGLETNIANISISDSETAVFGADFIPVSIYALYALNASMDVRASVTLPNVEDAADLFILGAGFTFHM